MIENIDLKCWVLISTIIDKNCSITEALNLLTILGASPSTSRKLLFDLIDKKILTVKLSKNDKRSKMISINDKYRLEAKEILKYDFKKFLNNFSHARQLKYNSIFNQTSY